MRIALLAAARSASAPTAAQTQAQLDPRAGADHARADATMTRRWQQTYAAAILK